MRLSQKVVFPSQKTESLDCCITATRACYKKGGCCGRQACRLDVDKAVSPHEYIFQMGKLGI